MSQNDLEQVINMPSPRTRLHYETTGNGSIPVILVHGYSMSSAVWEKVMPLFPARYRVFAIDLKGFGQSSPGPGYECPDLADDIAVFMDTLDLKQAVLIGHSFGGQVVQHFAARYPERVLALGLCNTVAATIDPDGLDTDVEERIKGYGSLRDNRKIFSLSVPRYFDTANVAPEDIKFFIEIALKADGCALRETLRANYVTPALPPHQYDALRVPVLIVVSTHDPFGTFGHAAAMSDAFPMSRIEVIARCGHSPMWERPAEFAEKLIRFLDTSLQPAASRD